MIPFIIGLIVGVWIGFIGLAIFTLGSNADDCAECLIRGDKEGRA